MATRSCQWWSSSFLKRWSSHCPGLGLRCSDPVGGRFNRAEPAAAPRLGSSDVTFRGLTGRVPISGDKEGLVGAKKRG